MKGAKYKDYIHRYKIMMLLGVLICFSCCTEYIFETEKDTPAPVSARSISFPSSLTDFFSHSCNGLDSVINTLRDINKEKNFIGSFLKKYGIPLWNYTLILKGEEEVSFYVPLYQGKSLLSIDAFWFFHISDGKVTYAPFRHTDGRIKDNEQRFIFDLLSWYVFGESNASGLVFKEKENSSRAWIVIEKCWDVYTGTEGNLEYKYTNCIQNAYWLDETMYWLATSPEEDSSGGSVSIGGGSSNGGTGTGTMSASASDIFSNDEFTNDSWNMVNYLLEGMMEDCMGEALFYGIKEKLNGDKITFRFIEETASNYNRNSGALSISVNQLESHVLFHEMFHLYQALSESGENFKKSLMNREIECHYAQYLFLKKQSPLWNVETNFLYVTDERHGTCPLINRFIDDYGMIRNESLRDCFESLLVVNVVQAFRANGYENYPFKDESLEQTFGIVKELTNNCKQ